MRKIYMLIAAVMLTVMGGMLAPQTVRAQVSVGISVRFGPPPLRVLAVQPMAPGPGYLWTPGYWAWSPEGYYWVPGAWVLAPEPGFLWTPGYWGYGEGVYVWHPGYWGPRVGFYGGINYGWGYFGTGFVGGRWDRGRFYYNTAVWRVNERVVHTTYVDRTVIRNVEVNRVSYNGGPGGVRARANGEEMRYAQERHMDAVPMQNRHQERARTMARRNREFHGRQGGQGGGGRQAERRGGPGEHGQGKGRNDKRDRGDKRGPGGGR